MTNAPTHNLAARNPNEQTVVNFFDTLGSGDLNKLGELLYPDIIWTVMNSDIPGSGPHEGRDHVLNEFLAPVRGSFKPGDPKVVIDNLVSTGDCVMAETRALGERADGRQYNNRYAWAFELRDGKVQKIREYMDSYYVVRFFDLLAPKQGA
jgi:ketosteroid isomerase-like protein